MIAAWMLYGTIVGALLATAAYAADAMLRMAHRPVRWVWLCALALTFGFIASASTRPAQQLALSMKSESPSRLVAAPRSAIPLWREASIVLTRTLETAIARPIRYGIAGLQHVLPARALPWIGAAWLLAAMLLVALFVAVQLRFHRARRTWPATHLHGVRVRVSPTAGPAVIGLSHPEIVVPRWLLGRELGEQRLVLAHEQEHLRARDPIVLVVGWLAIALVPWNPAVWFMVSRLRLAVELDCDARVLRGGAVARTYGMLLIDLAEYCSGLRVGAPALADDASHLQQRLNAMKPEFPKFARTRASAIALLAVSALVVACETKMPTSADIDQMNVAAAEQGARKVMLVNDAHYTIDGVAATADQAHTLDATTIASINIVKGANGNEINIITREGADRQATRKAALYSEMNGVMQAKSDERGGTPSGTVFYRKRSLQGATAESTMVSSIAHPKAFTGLVFINGVKSDPSAIQTLDRNSIKSVEVIKGAAAAERYNDPAAVNGVIDITTKSAGPSK